MKLSRLLGRKLRDNFEISGEDAQGLFLIHHKEYPTPENLREVEYLWRKLAGRLVSKKEARLRKEALKLLTEFGGRATNGVTEYYLPPSPHHIYGDVWEQSYQKPTHQTNNSLQFIKDEEHKERIKNERVAFVAARRWFRHHDRILMEDNILCTLFVYVVNQLHPPIPKDNVGGFLVLTINGNSYLFEGNKLGWSWVEKHKLSIQTVDYGTKEAA